MHGPQAYIALDARGALLQWDEPEGSMRTGFEVYRVIDDQEYKQHIGLLPPDARRFRTRELRRGTYLFRIYTIGYDEVLTQVRSVPADVEIVR